MILSCFFLFSILASKISISFSSGDSLASLIWSNAPDKFSSNSLFLEVPGKGSFLVSGIILLALEVLGADLSLIKELSTLGLYLI